MKQSIKTLEAWRRGDDSAQCNPKEIWIAIDDCVLAAKRYELVRTLNAHDFKVLFIRNLNGENFDNMIDALIEARAR